MAEDILFGLRNRILQMVLRNAPGATSLRVTLNRWRGVKIGEGVWIGHDALIETSHPHLVTLKDRSAVYARVIIIAHMREGRGVVLEEDSSVGPGAIVLPNVTIGRGSFVTAGSVVTKSVPPMTMVQGNPAAPIARIGVALSREVSLKEFSKHLTPLRGARPPEQ